MFGVRAGHAGRGVERGGAAGGARQAVAALLRQLRLHAQEEVWQVWPPLPQQAGGPGLLCCQSSEIKAMIHDI